MKTIKLSDLVYSRMSDNVFDFITPDGGIVLYCKDFRDSEDQPLHECAARVVLESDFLDFEAQDKIIHNMYVYGWIVKDTDADAERKEFINSLSEYERELMVDTDSFGRDTSEKYGYTSYRTAVIRSIEDELVSYSEGEIDVAEFDNRMSAFEADWEDNLSSYDEPSFCKISAPIDFASLVYKAIEGLEWESSFNSRETLEAESNYVE